jgi:hypothetical protein
MTKEEILEGNKLIVKFIEAEYLNDFNYPEENEIGWYSANGDYMGNDLIFHSSWNWLMPVVERIQHLEDEIPVRIDFQIHLLGAVELHINHKRVFGMSAFEPGTLINAVYGGVVDFIKWYNTQ